MHKILMIISWTHVGVIVGFDQKQKLGMLHCNFWKLFILELESSSPLYASKQRKRFAEVGVRNEV